MNRGTDLPEFAGPIRRIDSHGPYAPLAVTLADIVAERAAGWTTFHPEDYCHRCGHQTASWSTPPETWNPVMRRPDGSEPWEGIICLPCFIDLHTLVVGPRGWTLTRDADGITRLTVVSP